MFSLSYGRLISSGFPTAKNKQYVGARNKELFHQEVGKGGSPKAFWQQSDIDLYKLRDIICDNFVTNLATNFASTMRQL